MGKYTIALGRSAPEKPLAKAESAGDRVILFAGYTHTDQSNPKSPVTFGSAAGGIPLTLSTVPPLPDNDAFTKDRILQFFWAGTTYQFDGGLGLTAAYYHVS